MKNLENYGVQEMNAKELREVDGGVFGVDDIIAIAGAVIYLYNEGSDFVAGFNHSYKRAKNGRGGASGSW